MTDIRQYEPLWGSWHVESQIGEGSYGKVYKIRKDEFGKTYDSAMKILSIPPSEVELKQVQSEGMDDASARSYFHAFVTDIVQEIDLMSAFRGNSNIVSLEDHKVIERQGEIGWDILIRMELLTTLSDYITDKPMTPDDVLKLGIHICRALELCGVKKTIHRDIKPDNIFVSQYGEFKLGDFGIARQIDRTMSGLSKKGTYTYMAPEVFKGEEYGPSVDTYSLGIVMYRFLNRNRAPFLPDFPDPITPNARDEALQRRMGGEPLPAIDGIDPKLSAIVCRACAFDRNERFGDATEMREALEVLAGSLSYTPSAAGGPQISTPRHYPEPRHLSAEDREIDATESVFTNKAAFFAEKPPQVKPEPQGRSEISKRLSLAGGLSFGVLCLLCWLSGEKSDLFVACPLYVLCIVQCCLAFRDRRVNITFFSILFFYLGYAFFVAFDLFDYHMLTLACGLCTLLAARNGPGRRQTAFALCAALVFGAVLSGILVYRSMGNIASGLYSPHVGGAVAVPFIMLFAAPLCLLLASERVDHRKYAHIGLTALQLFPALIFVLHVVLSHAVGISPYDNIGMLFYIADADPVGLSTGKFAWWSNWRFIGQLVQLTAFVPLFGLAVEEAERSRSETS